MPSNRQIIVGKVLESIPVGLIVLDPRGRLAAASPSASAMLGQDLAALRGRDWTRLFPEPGDNPAFFQAVRELMDRQRPEIHREVAWLGPHGLRRLALTASFLRSGEAPAGAVLILDDITELHLAREREYQALMERNRLQRAMIESLNNLALGVAHQVRNPLTAIGGFARRLVRFLEARGLPTDEARVIFEQAVNLEGVVNAVSALSGLPPARPRRVELGPILDQAARFAQIPALAAGRSVAFDLDLEAGEVWVDPALLARVLEALTTNAVEFARGPEVRIRVCARNAPGLVLTFRDNGPGVDPRHRDFLFDPFFSTKTRGLGMGLTLARRIVMEHGGDMALAQDGEPGAGFVIRFAPGPGNGADEAWPGGGVGADAGLGAGLGSGDLAARAMRLGLDVGGMSRVDAVRALQRAEGFEACYARGLARSCGQESCVFRRDCLPFKSIGDEPDLLFRAPGGRA